MEYASRPTAHGAVQGESSAGANPAIRRMAGRTCAVIPALNEEAAIAGVIGALHAAGIGTIRVVDNGSTDRTAAVAAALGAQVLTETRRGYGAACWRGIRDLPQGTEWVLFCDADGSDDLSGLDGLFERADRGADLVLGDRRTFPENRTAMTPQQRFGNALATALIALGWGYRFRDLGPLRLIHRTALERIAMRDRGFGWTVEMQVRAVEERLRIAEVPVRYRTRRGGRSKISGTLAGTIRAGWVILATIGRLRLRRPPGKGRTTA